MLRRCGDIGWPIRDVVAGEMEWVCKRGMGSAKEVCLANLSALSFPIMLLWL